LPLLLIFAMAQAARDGECPRQMPLADDAFR
jgi:hypothetical protein